MKERGICLLCKVKPQFNKGKNYGYRKYCEGCYKNKLDKKICELCDFIPTHPCQMDIHHKDGNHLNNNSNNIQVLCANCHRLQHCKNSPGF